MAEELEKKFEELKRDLDDLILQFNQKLGAGADVQSKNGNFRNIYVSGDIYDELGNTKIPTIQGVQFGGDGSDGALAISSGTTTLDANGAQILVKNYTSISITGTAQLTISNPHANGTILVLKSQGAVTITSTNAAGAIRLYAMGGQAGAGGGQNTDGNDGNIGTGVLYESADPSGNLGTSAADGLGGATPGAVEKKQLYSVLEYRLASKTMFVMCGSGGAGGAGTNQSGASGGDGGAGGGALIIECAGNINFPSTANIISSGEDGANGETGVNSYGTAGGGGGSAGTVLILYGGTATDITGTITAEGGDGGDGGETLNSPTGNSAGGGSGASSYTALGGAGGNSANNGSNAGGNGAGGGGAGSRGFAGPARTGGTGGSSEGGYIFQNKYFA